MPEHRLEPENLFMFMMDFLHGYVAWKSNHEQRGALGTFVPGLADLFGVNAETPILIASQLPNAVPRLLGGNLTERFVPGDLIWDRAIEYAGNADGQLGDKFSVSALGRSTTDRRLHLVIDVYEDMLCTLTGSTRSGRGMEGFHAPELKYQYIHVCSPSTPELVDRQYNQNGTPHLDFCIDERFAERPLEKGTYFRATGGTTHQPTADYKYAGRLQSKAINAILWLRDVVSQLDSNFNPWRVPRLINQDAVKVGLTQLHDGVNYVHGTQPPAWIHRDRHVNSEMLDNGVSYRRPSAGPQVRPMHFGHTAPARRHVDDLKDDGACLPYDDEPFSEDV